MSEQFRISYPLTVEDNLMYQEKIFLSNKNPSIKDSIRRWKRLCFILVVLFYPLLIFVLTNSVRITAIVVVIALALFGLLWINATKIYWKSYRSKAKKDLINIYFENDAEGIVTLEAVFTEDEVTIISVARTKTIKKSEIDLTEITDTYILFYTIKYDGSIIPLKAISDKQQVIDWFY